MTTRNDASLWAHLGAVLGFAALAVVALHRLGAAPWFAIGWSDLPHWLATTAVEDVLVAVLRQVALACAYWILGSTMLYLLARASRLPRALRAVAWCAPAGVRRIVDRAVAVGLMGSVLTSGPVALAAAAPREPGPGGAQVVEAIEHPPVPDFLPPPPRLLPSARLRSPSRAAPPAPESASAPATTPPPAAAGPVASVDPPAVPQGSRTVAHGESLWTIAEDVLAGALGRRPEVGETHTYWRSVIRHNEGRLRSGDPDVIYAGEVLRLPQPTVGRDA